MVSARGALRFDNRVAVVTGAGNGLGRVYAEYLGRLGAKVVVNDISSTPCKTTNQAIYAADRVVEALREENVIANHDSVEEGEKIINTAMKKWGRVDIIINNAGIVRDSTFAKMSKADWDAVYKVHLEGTMSITKAAWDIMREQKYGRIVNISSASGLYGNFGQTNYAAAKMGILGFGLTLAKEGSKQNINVNTVAPLASSQMTAGLFEQALLARLDPQTVAPFVAYLCHESCTRTGKVYEVGAGWVSQVRWQRSKGVMFPSDAMTLDNISQQIDQIENFDLGGQDYPQDLYDSLNRVRDLVFPQHRTKT